MEKVKCPNCEAENLSNSKYCSRCGHAMPTFVLNKPEESVIPQTNASTDKKKKAIGAVVGVLAFFASYFAVQYFFFSPPTFDKVMMAAASEINKTCPIMVDQETRLDNAIALPENSLQYNYTLVNTESAQVNPDELKTYIEPGIVNLVKSSPDMKIYRDNKTTIIYNYRDKNGVFILKLVVTPEMYQ